MSLQDPTNLESNNPKIDSDNISMESQMTNVELPCMIMTSTPTWGMRLTDAFKNGIPSLSISSSDLKIFKTMAVILLITFLDNVGTAMASPVIPLLIVNNVVGGTMSWVGYCMTVKYVSQFISILFIGLAGDLYGRKIFLCLTLFTNMIGPLGQALGPNIYVVFLFFFLEGISGYVDTVTQAAVSELIRLDAMKHDKNSGSRIALALSMVNGSTYLAFAIGPLITGAFMPFGPKAPLFASSVSSGMAFLIALFVFDETCPKENQLKARKTFKWPWERRKEKKEEGVEKVDSSKYSSQSWFSLKIILLFLTTLSYTTFMPTIQSILPIYISKEMNWENSIGLLFAVNSIGSLITQFFLIPLMSSRLKNPYSTIIGLSLQFIGSLFLLFGGDRLWMFFMGLFFGGLGLSMARTFNISSASQLSGSTNQGLILTSLQSGAALMRIIAPIFATQSYDIVILPFLILTCICGFGLIPSILFAWIIKDDEIYITKKSIRKRKDGNVKQQVKILLKDSLKERQLGHWFGNLLDSRDYLWKNGEILTKLDETFPGPFSSVDSQIDFDMNKSLPLDIAFEKLE